MWHLNPGDLTAGSLMIVLVWAAYSDIMTFTIPNRIPVGVAVLYAAWASAMWPSVAVLAALVTAGVILVIGFGAFCVRLLGGGDVKLLAALGLWAGPAHVAELLIITCCAGGVLSLVVLAANWRQRGAAMLSEAKLAMLSADLGGYRLSQQRVPYGVAIAAAGGVVAFRLMSG